MEVLLECVMLEGRNKFYIEKKRNYLNNIFIQNIFCRNVEINVIDFIVVVDFIIDFFF